MGECSDYGDGLLRSPVRQLAMRSTLIHSLQLLHFQVCHSTHAEGTPSLGWTVFILGPSNNLDETFSELHCSLRLFQSNPSFSLFLHRDQIYIIICRLSLLTPLFSFCASDVFSPISYLQVKFCFGDSFSVGWSEKAGSKMRLGLDHLLLAREPSPYMYQFPISAVKNYHKLKTQIYYLKVLKARSPKWVSLDKTRCWQDSVPFGGSRGESPFLLHPPQVITPVFIGL